MRARSCMKRGARGIGVVADHRSEAGWRREVVTDGPQPTPLLHFLRQEPTQVELARSWMTRILEDGARLGPGEEAVLPRRISLNGLSAGGFNTPMP